MWLPDYWQFYLVSRGAVAILLWTKRKEGNMRFLLNISWGKNISILHWVPASLWDKIKVAYVLVSHTFSELSPQ